MGFSLLKAGLGFITGGPAGAVAGGLSGFLKPAKQPGGGPTSGLQIGQIAPDSVISTNKSLGYGAVSSSTTKSYYSTGNKGGGGGGMDLTKAGAACPVGFRLNKSTYVTRGGGTSRWPSGLAVHPKGSTCVKRRHINAGNGRAAKHAVHRLVSFYRLANQVAKQLRKAASRAHIRGARRQRALPRGGGVEVVNVD